MKKMIFLLAAVMMMAASCSKDDSNVVKSPEQNVQKSTMKLYLKGGAATKGDPLQTADEAKVNDIQIFVFNGDALDGYKHATAAEVTALVVEIDATAGTRDIYAFINAPDLSSYISKSTLLAAASNLTDDNAADSFVMSGKLESQNVGTSYSGTINVDRYAARVRLNKITRNFTNPSYQGVDFKVTKIYLTSAVDNVLYSGSAPASYVWLNASFGASRALSTTNAFVYNAFSTPIAIANGASHATAYSFYGYPNPHSSDDGSSPMTYRKTRIVVECWIDINNDHVVDSNEYFTYPVSMGALESNKSYEIVELILTRLGNSSDGDDDADDGEDDDIESTTMSATVVVNDWTQVLVGVAGTVTI